MNIVEFDEYFMDNKASIYVHNTHERTFVNEHYRNHYGAECFSNKHSEEYPFLIFNGTVVGWTGKSKENIVLKINFEEFESMVDLREEIEAFDLEEIL